MTDLFKSRQVPKTDHMTSLLKVVMLNNLQEKLAPSTKPSLLFTETGMCAKDATGTMMCVGYVLIITSSLLYLSR